MSGSTYVAGAISVTTSEEAIPLGEVTSPGWSYFMNHDASNTISLRNGSGAADLISLAPGEYCFFRFKSTAVPYIISNNSGTEVEYCIFSA